VRRPAATSARSVFGANLRRAREARGLSQEALGAAAEMHRTAVGAVERGEANVTIDNMERLAAAVGMDMSELLNRRGASGGSQG
jgi:transcriptional regulator with XRE-family HTH domain